MDVVEYNGQEKKAMPKTTETVKKLDLLHYIQATFGNLNKTFHEWIDRGDGLHEALEVLESLAFEGTADVINHKEAGISSESLDTCSKFTLACDLCFEKEIFPLFGKLELPVTSDHPPGSTMAEFWIGVCKDVGGKLMAGQGLKVCIGDLRCSSDTSAVADDVDSYVQEALLAAGSNAFSHLLFLRYCLLFMRMNDTKPSSVFCNFPYKAMSHLCHQQKALSKQHFLEAARLLLDRISDDSYWEIMTAILDSATSNKKDPLSYERLGKVKRATDEHADKICSYQRLFTGFWEVGACRGRNASINQKGRRELVFTVLLMDDERIRDMVFEEISSELKEDLLMGSLGVRRRNFCIKWAHRREVQMLERFFRGCTRHRKELLVEFRDAAVAMSPELAGRIWGYEFGVHIKEGQWQVLLDVLLEVVDKVIADRPDTGRLASLSID